MEDFHFKTPKKVKLNFDNEFSTIPSKTPKSPLISEEIILKMEDFELKEEEIVKIRIPIQITKITLPYFT